ncbi:AbrB/MazE/SpoVT family DNA-binding domain-containing protein [Geomicrobium sediminis]|uniref:AbrB family looped-hinge helix DNA binding protein n=1 Tax=Geomicrobium sediminis TaxID=1347788 RepID=A0ABS2P728_9BACL|nr:AbrB/MazE/SpoVT family DNA-binding domain-containing protein [Geomicrobium sediminis]MBM7631122.1 AbrB family looped-hinge helix DNA binding protein [Geomicrobium sediminis]
MKSIGIVRRIDDLGRVVIPKETRKMLGIKEGDALAIGVQGDRVIVEKYEPHLTKDDLYEMWRVEVGESKAKLLYRGAAITAVMKMSEEDAKTEADRP